MIESRGRPPRLQPGRERDWSRRFSVGRPCPSAGAESQVGTPCGARGPPRSTGAGEGSTGASSGLRLAAAAPALRLVADRGHPTRSPPRLKRGTCQRRARLGRPRRETRGARQLGRWDRGRLARCPHRLLLLVSTALARPYPRERTVTAENQKTKDQGNYVVHKSLGPVRIDERRAVALTSIAPLRRATPNSPSAAPPSAVRPPRSMFSSDRYAATSREPPVPPRRAALRCPAIRE